MRPNKLRATLLAGKTAFGTMIQEIRTPAVVMILANAGFDFVFIDMEHSAFSIETASDLIKTIRLTGMTCLVRVPDTEYHWIARMLDAGAEGIMVPRVETRAQVEYIVQSVRYPPIGRRGLSVARGHNDYQKADSLAFTEHANHENMVILQIESQQAINDIDDLVSIPGVDMAIIGPQDLSLSYGLPSDMGHENVQNAIGKVVAACQKNNIPSGMHIGNAPMLAHWHQQGMRVITYSSDLEMLNNAGLQAAATIRQAVGG